MNTKTSQRWASLVVLLMVLPLSGCSMLGFSAYPIAHVMTDDTKTVLENTPRNIDVARELSKEVPENHYLQPGDELLVEIVTGQSTDIDSAVRLPADQQVMSDGTLDLAEFGRVVVVSLTLEQAEQEIQRIIAKQSNESVQVNVRMIQPVHRYYVIGEVSSPGAYPLTGHETVLDAIMEAGGLTPRASACDLLLARPTTPKSCRVTLPVCYRAITQLGDTTTNYHLKPGDRIFVARQSLREELSGYFSGGKTCERCCGCQTACCEPRTAETGLPACMPVAVRWIVPVKDDDQQQSNISPTDSSPIAPSNPVPQTIENEPRKTNELPEPNRDGELDFGMLMLNGH